MNTGRVTVVIPVYNVEKYLDRCVSSVVNQTYGNLEIILVDDGSPDRCPQMCDEWAKRDSRIKTVHKQNAGLGMARNTGIDNATGEYICFFDSDDYIEPDTIEECVQMARREFADIVSFGNDRITQEGVVLSKRIPNPPKTVFSDKEINRMLLPKALSYDPKTGENWYLSLSGCFALFSMSLIEQHHWRFVSEREIICEDFYSVLKLYAKAKKIAIVSKIFYHYTVNSASLSHTYREDRYEKLVYFYQKLMTLCDELGITELVAVEAAATFAGLSIGCFKQIAASKGTIPAKLEKIGRIINDSCLQTVLAENDFTGDGFGKKALWYAIRKRKTIMCYAVVQARNFKEKTNGFSFKNKKKNPV